MLPQRRYRAKRRSRLVPRLHRHWGKTLNLRVKYRESIRRRERCCARTWPTGSNSTGGGPIILTPKDAFRCLMGSDIEFRVAGNCILRKERQDPFSKLYYKSAFEPD
jgi:hypothetical protein